MNTENVNTIELNGVKLRVDNPLFDFAIHQKPSSNVDYFGLDYIGSRMFVQFKGGTGSYMYNDVPVILMDASLKVESIGKFISSTIVNKFQSIKFDERLVKPLNNSTDNGGDHPDF
jgi:hypothetical protein